MLNRLFARVRSLVRRNRIDTEVDEGLRLHLDTQIRANVARGMTPSEARRVALRDMGGVTQTKEAVREVRWTFFDTLGQDVRYAFRSFRRNPGFAAVAILTLALGIGAVTAIFTVADAVIFRPLPFPDPDRLVWLEVTPKSSRSRAIGVFSYELFTDVRDQTDVFDGVAAYAGAGRLMLPGHREGLVAGHASSALFRVLGASAVLGRLPESRDERAGAPRVAVVSYGAWVRYFGSDRTVIGRALVAKAGTADSDEPITIVGVLAPPFVFPYPRGIVEYDVWMPITPEVVIEPHAIPRSASRWPVIGRLKPRVSLATAQQQLDVLAARVAAAYPDTDKDNGLRATRLHDKIVGKAGPPLLAFLAAVGFLLLIACANVANLLLARASARQREFAVRVALGAGRFRIARQVLTESAVLSLIGGAAGLAFGFWAFRAFVALSPKMPRLDEASIDYRVLGFTCFAVTLATLLSGLAPAVQCSRGSVSETLARAGGHGASRRPHRSINLVVVAELSIALVLLVGGGLMINSFVRLLRFDLGIDPASVVALNFSQPPLPAAETRGGKAPFDEERRRKVVVLTDESRRIGTFNEEVLRRVSAVPGVIAAATTTRLPLDMMRGFTGITLEGRATPPGRASMVDIRRVSAGYFRALGIRFVSGRSFSESDREGAPPVVVINRTMAQRLWPGESAVGKGVRIGTRGQSFRVVGVIVDVRHRGAMGSVEPEMYIPDAQDPRSFSTLVVKTSGSAAAVARAVEAEMKRAGFQVSRVRLLEDLLAEMLAPSRFSTFVLATFSLLALILSLVGVHGVLSYSVVQRTHEIGVRMALGSGTRGVVRLVLGQALGHAMVGLAVGLVAALALGRLLQAMLFQIAATDPATLACVCLLLIAGVVLAAYPPARRAARIDPIAALRCE
jgi:putative ABC transport system permease protein